MVQISVRLTDPIPNDSNIGRTNRSNYSDTIPTNPNISQTNQSNKLSIDVAAPILKKGSSFFPSNFLAHSIQRSTHAPWLPTHTKQNKRFSIDGAFLSGNGRRGIIASRGMYSPIPLFPPLGEWGNREWSFLDCNTCRT